MIRGHFISLNLPDPEIASDADQEIIIAGAGQKRELRASHFYGNEMLRDNAEVLRPERPQGLAADLEAGGFREDAGLVFHIQAGHFFVVAVAEAVWSTQSPGCDAGGDPVATHADGPDLSVGGFALRFLIDSGQAPGPLHTSLQP